MRVGVCVARVYFNYILHHQPVRATNPCGTSNLFEHPQNRLRQVFPQEVAGSKLKEKGRQLHFKIATLPLPFHGGRSEMRKRFIPMFRCKQKHQQQEGKDKKKV
ncbi:hypothetical protein CDAR_496471 [Caerostris darwini]|uniref:Uncharacterized protein n=1 Tax=Caerostris darwini TaxID=1538125 RepID=A0AAV4Q8Q2_9ARAC|nr:hypothetical protein CDAR_496471 [Caerostris darwini]